MYMKISQKGIDLIKSFEGCYLTAYKMSGRGLDDWIWNNRSSRRKVNCIWYEDYKRKSGTTAKKRFREI